MHIGLVETAAGVGGILGAVVAPWIIDRFATGRLTVAIAWSFLPLLVPMALWNSPVVVAARARRSVLLLNPAGNAGIGAYRVAVTPPELHRPGAVDIAVRLDVGDAARAGARRRAAGLARRVGGGPGAGRRWSAGTALIPTLSRSVRSVPRPAVWRRELVAVR